MTFWVPPPGSGRLIRMSEGSASATTSPPALWPVVSAATGSTAPNGDATSCLPGWPAANRWSVPCPLARVMVHRSPLATTVDPGSVGICSDTAAKPSSGTDALLPGAPAPDRAAAATVAWSTNEMVAPFGA